MHAIMVCHVILKAGNLIMLHVHFISKIQNVLAIDEISILIQCTSLYCARLYSSVYCPGGTLDIYWWGCAAAHPKRGVLGTGTTQKRGVLGTGTTQKRGVLGTGTSGKRGS